MVKLSNGHKVKYFVASGALGFSGKGWAWEWIFVWLGLIKPELFAVIVKSLTLHTRKGNLRWICPWRCFRFLPSLIGGVNAIGLTNPGINWWMQKYGRKVNSRKQRIIGSIFGSADELVEMAERFNHVDVIALQVNVSCPNTGENLKESVVEHIVETCERVKRVSRHPVILKLSCAQDYMAISKRLAERSKELFGRLNLLVEAIEPNSVPWDTVFPGKESPLAKYGIGNGGVSGPAAQKHNWKMIKELATLPIPVIGNSVWNYPDLANLDKMGASAYSFGLVHLPFPWRPTAFVRRHMKEVCN